MTLKILESFMKEPRINFKVIGKEERVIGKVIIFLDRGYAIEKRMIDEKGEYYTEIVDRFDISSRRTMGNYKRAVYKEAQKHLSPETKTIYIDEDVAKFLERCSKV